MTIDPPDCIICVLCLWYQLPQTVIWVWSVHSSVMQIELATFQIYFLKKAFVLFLKEQRPRSCESHVKVTSKALGLVIRLHWSVSVTTLPATEKLPRFVENYLELSAWLALAERERKLLRKSSKVESIDLRPHFVTKTYSSFDFYSWEWQNSNVAADDGG